ncbi:hypothetical protein RGQ29_031993 [Quercus rubra]|uniref:Uncharacterized protein n=1 Tax=Quercus rubra TaxID=3512 RepID=A0AAN7DT37_QUERU|nr:hypothetical protein RGQ29_031993 [Quercus rubra]
MSQAQFSTDTLTVQHDEEKREFYVLMGKDKAFLNYEEIGENAVNLWHTEAAFDYVVEKDLRMKVTCTYLEKYLRENPQDKYQKQLI